MKELKTAYELANQRIIASRPIIENKEEDDSVVPVEAPIEFVTESKPPLEPLREAEYSSAFIDQEDTQEKIIKAALDDFKKESVVQKDQDKSEIAVQEAKEVHYDGPNIEVHWAGNFLDYGGYARMNRNMVFGLSDKNVKVKVDIDHYLVHVNKSTQEQLEMMSRMPISDSAPKVFGGTVPLNFSHAGPKILYTMIETSNKVHPDYAGKLNMASEIWVPTEYGKKILEASNVYPQIKVMPLGVDVNHYNPETKPLNVGMALRQFRFISVFRWGYRKGYDILLRAYLEEFSSRDDVSLLLVSRPVKLLEGVGEQQMIEDFNNIRASIDKPENSLPHVALYTKPITERKMPQIYALGNAFVLISRGEGYGLIFQEAASMGLPVIASNCSGHSDFLTKDNSYLVDPDEYVVADRLSKLGKDCRFYEGQEFPEFRRKAINTVKEHMRFVMENYQEAKIKAQKLRTQVIANYTWDKAVDRVYNRLLELSE